MPAAAAVVCVQVFRNRKKFRVQLNSFEKTASMVLAANVLVALTMSTVSPITVPHASRIEVPSASLYGVTVHPGNGDIIVKYVWEGLEVANVTGCTISSSAGRISCTWSMCNNTVIVHVPREYYAEMNFKGEGFLTLVLNASLTCDAKLYAKYLVRPTFAPLSIKKDGCTVSVSNPNFFPVKANVSVYYASTAGSWSVNSTELALMPKEEILFNLTSARFSYISVQHVFLGKTVAEKVQVTYDGRP